MCSDLVKICSSKNYEQKRAKIVQKQNALSPGNFFQKGWIGRKVTKIFEKLYREVIILSEKYSRWWELG